MKKALLLCGLALFLFAAGLNARNNRTFAPKKANDGQLVLVDSVYRYYGQDSTLFYKDIYNYDTAAKVMTVTVNYLGGEGWSVFGDSTYTFNADGTLRSLVYRESDDKVLKSRDSTVYSYAGNETFTVRYSVGGGSALPKDSIYTAADAKGNDTLCIEYITENQVWKKYEKRTYKYNESDLLSVETFYVIRDKGDEDWSEEERYEYFYDKNGIDTLKMCYKYVQMPNIRTQAINIKDVHIKSKYVTTVNAKGLKDLTYFIQTSDMGTNWDTARYTLYAYDANNRLTESTDFEYSDDVMWCKDVYTYDQFGMEYTHTYYELDQTFDHMITEVYYRSERQEPAGVEDVTEQPAREVVKVTKYMINGQLFIERDGITYDAMGRIVRR